jgi:hypothetical protein
LLREKTEKKKKKKKKKRDCSLDYSQRIPK